MQSNNFDQHQLPSPNNQLDSDLLSVLAPQSPMVASPNPDSWLLATNPIEIGNPMSPFQMQVEASTAMPSRVEVARAVLDPQLAALQRSLLQQPDIPISNPNPMFQQPKSTNPIQISIQPKASIFASALPASIAPLASGALQPKAITIKPSSALSSLMARPQSSSRTPEELGAFLRAQDSTPAMAPQPQPQPVQPIQSIIPAVETEISLAPQPDDKHVGSFGTNVEDLVVQAAMSINPGDPVVLARDLNAPVATGNNSDLQNVYRVQVQNSVFQPVGYLPNRIGNWLAVLISTAKLRLRARRPNHFTPSGLLLVIDIFVQKITPDDWRSFSMTEKGAWHQLGIQVGRPLSEIVPIRSLQPDLEPLLTATSQSLVMAGSNIKRSSGSNNSSTGSGGIKRSAESDVSSLDSFSRSKRSKTAQSQVVLKINNSSQLQQQLAQSAPPQQLQFGQFSTASASSSSASASYQPVPAAGSGGFSLSSSSTDGLSDQLETKFIDQLLNGLQQDYLRNSQEYHEKQRQTGGTTTTGPGGSTTTTTTGTGTGEEPVMTFADVDPSPRLNVALRPYQLEGMRWLIAREETDSSKMSLSVPPGWVEHSTESGKRYFMNEETKQTYWTFPYDDWALSFDRAKKRLPVRVCGGVLADDMGMGKTIQMISLIVTNTPLSIDSTESPKKVCPTLIVCPLSVLNQWFSELNTHVAQGTLSIYVYHGTSRKKSAEHLAKHDVVLTTYATLAGEYQGGGAKAGPLNSVEWYRVVLDEAHTIKDKGTLTAKAACALSGQRRWAVTGTPIQNKLAEVYSLFIFLRLQPFGDQETWLNAIMKPIRNRDERGLDRLRNILAGVLLRRTKDQKIDAGESIVSLPARTVAIRKVEFTQEEKKFYDDIWGNSKLAFENMVAHGTALQNYAHILELLLRVRQACDHPKLVLDHQKRRQDHEKSLHATEMGDIKSSLRSSKQNKSTSTELASSSASNQAPVDEMVECSNCFEDVPLSTAFTTRCDHVLCRTCVQDYLFVGEDMLQFEESLSGSSPAKITGAGNCPTCNHSLQFESDVTPLSLSSAAAAQAKVTHIEPSSTDSSSEAPKKQEQEGDDMEVDQEGKAIIKEETVLEYEDEPEPEPEEPQMNLRSSMAFRPDLSTVTEPIINVPVEPLSNSIDLRVSNTIGSLRSSNFNSQWTFLDPAQNYPIVSEEVKDPLEVVPPVDSVPKRSVKIKALLDDLVKMRAEQPDDKAVVFSQWTSMLDIIEEGLGEEGIFYGRLDGKMSQKAREDAIAQFKTNPNVKVFLISMKAGGLGLNLVVANHVYLMDPWWNPSTEEQAIDRCHRIGQTKPVYVTRFIIENSIEERILELQEKKRSLARGALGRKKANLKEMRMEDLRLLFND